MATAFIAFSSNLGDRLAQFKQAKSFLENFGGIDFVGISEIYETEPFCHFEKDRGQPLYLNQIMKVETSHTAMGLFLLCKEVECRMGKDTSSVATENGLRRYFPRRIDLDLLLYEDEVIDSPALQIPHPRFHTRRYDLVPFASLAPEKIHPILNKTIAELLDACEDTCDVQRYA